MICLAVTTANSLMSVAILRDDAVLFSTESPDMRDQGPLLFRHVEAGLATAGIGYADIDLLAAVTGPGSFTGIRIGLSALRGLSLAMNKPVIGIDSFAVYGDALRDAPAGAQRVVAIESWREELYLRLDGHEPVNISAEAFASTLSSTDNIVIAGDAAETLQKVIGRGTIYLLREAGAVIAARLAQRLFAEAGTPAVKPEPYYLRGADVSASTKIRRIDIV